MENELKKVIGMTSLYLDFHSVVDGFRKVCLLGLREYPDNFNEAYGTNVPSFVDQAVFIGDYVQQNSANHQLIPGWEHLYFLAHNSKVRDVGRLLSEYPRPVRSKEGQGKLGLILGFPACCVDAHVQRKSFVRKNGFYVLPFTPCSDACERPWMEEYKRLARKYRVDLSKHVIRGNIHKTKLY